MESLKKQLKSTFKGKSTIPYVTLNNRLGKVFFNKKAIDDMFLKRGDTIDFRKGTKDSLYVQKVSDKEHGWKLYGYGNNGKTLAFGDKQVIQAILDMLEIEMVYVDLCRLRIIPTVKSGVFMLKLIS